MGKATKATKKFISSGQLKKTIQTRRKQQQVTKKIQKRRGNKGGKGKEVNHSQDDEEDEKDLRKVAKSSGQLTVDSFLNGDFMDESDDDVQEDISAAEDSENEAEDEESDNDGSFASVDGLDDLDEENHVLQLSKLAEKDPEFYKYLQENDQELLNFNADEADVDSSGLGDDSGDVLMADEEEDEQVPTLTKDHLRQWQKSLLQQRSLRALRKLLVAFRSAAHMNEDGQALAWSIDSSSVYNKVVITALRYTPVVLEHHVPYKALANGKFKAPTQTPKFKALQKLILSHFHNVTHILSELTDEDTLRLALTESAKLVPYIISSRKSVKAYLKKCLDLWSSGSDSIRISAFLSIRKLAGSSDESIMDSVLKSTYMMLIRCSKSTSPHTLPSINLMKNSASDIFCADHATAYQHAFGYIRQLAIHLRNSMKIKSKESFKHVYNWQFVHCVDFWCTVLAKACDVDSENANAKESVLRSLIYPLVQVCIGAIKLVPNSRSHPFHLQIIRSLLHLTKHSQTYIPISSHLIPILTSCLVPTTRPKSSTLRPLDFDVQIRIPQQYVKTRVLSEGLTEESVFLLAEWLASAPVHGSVAFPEVVVPITILLRKSLKASKTGTSKESALVKTFVERVEESARWMEQRRKNVHFSPSKIGQVQEWERELKGKLDDTPLGKYVKVQRKTRDKRRKLVEKAREGEDEILEEE